MDVKQKVVVKGKNVPIFIEGEAPGVILISAIPFVGTLLAIFTIINGLWEVLYKSNLDWWHHEE